MTALDRFLNKEKNDILKLFECLEISESSLLLATRKAEAIAL